ncbi:MAG: phage antirepressor KilAC domain-containing protein [Oscillospiraceae bacterium]|nr:phage antirepressor KilAC domain-containing protein [Oscillospiraceae bacterium]
MNEVRVFQHEAFGSIRTVMIEGEPWFVGKDVAAALGYSNASKAVMVHVDEEDKRILMLPNSHFGNSVGKCYVINESGLYSLILSSKLPGAKAFKHWITSEVLPTIRRTGGYIADDEQFLRFYAPTADEPTMAFIRAQMEIARGLCRKIDADKPLVEFAGHVMGSSNAIDMNSMAKLAANNGIPIGRVRLFRWLREKRILMSNNLPYQRYIERGYFSIREKTWQLCGEIRTYRQTLVTGKGQEFILRKLREEAGVCL